MKPLADVCPDPKKVLELEPERLGQHVLDCLHDEENVKRAIIAKHLASNYHESIQHEIVHAIENALGWLVVECLLSESPYDQDLLYVTDRGKKAVADYRSEHPADVS